MSDIDLAVKASKHIEAALVRVLDAKGKGLHEKVSSVEKKLPAHLVKRIRFIATIRNKVVHDADYRKIDDRRAFKSTLRQVKKELRRMEGRTWSRWWFILLVVLFVSMVIGLSCYFELLDGLF